MKRTKTGLVPGVDVMEPRLVLSSSAPPLSQHALSGIVREVRSIVSTLARTGDTVEASAQLTALSTRLPSEPLALAVSWQNDIELYRPQSARSILATEKRLVSDLERYLKSGGAGDNGSVSGSGSTTPTAPTQGTAGTASPTPTPSPSPPATSLDSVSIQNTTGLDLVVTVQLNTGQPKPPYITETIAAQGDPIALFNFGTATNAFMTMSVSAADGAQTPPPWSNISLSQPTSGYNGTQFTISLFGPYFNVSV